MPASSFFDGHLSDFLDSQGVASIQAVTISFFRFESLGARVWVLGQMALGRLALTSLPGARFWKLCGSGTGEGFTPVPNTRVWAILVVWEDRETAERGTARSPLFRRWRQRAAESWTVFLTPTSARGAWSGQAPFRAEAEAGAGPLAALTRATIRPRSLLRFWQREPDISAVIGADPNVAFKIGIGEVPWLHQVTFSIWPDATAMDAFARGGPHARAIRAVRQEGWFREELYARFRVDGGTGTWGGADPLSNLQRSAP
ncbi:MAG: spheroidene monooxygenase [Paracoccaceae bacterium]|nr:spheroidene monooxygenase [Paracoccaceae bacterium]